MGSGVGSHAATRLDRIPIFENDFKELIDRWVLDYAEQYAEQYAGA